MAKKQKPDDQKEPIIAKSTETKHLKVTLTRDELLEAGQKLADAQARKTQLENDLASYKDQIKSQITSADADASRYGAMVREKYEFRPVVCDVVKNYTDERITITRRDTLEPIDHRRMTDSELATLPFSDQN
jgi:multidrug efflux pump subunit AcrA (membrane-fusion protein)